MMKFQEKYAKPKDQKWGNKKAGVKDGRVAPQVALSLKLKGQKCSTLSGGVLHSEQHMKEGKKTYHMFWSSIVSGRIYWPNSSKELLIQKRQKIPLHPCLSSFVLMDLYVRMWKLCMLIGKLWCFRWNCWINSRWKEARRIQSGESFRSSQVRVKHMSWHPLQIYKCTCTAGK